MSEPASGGSYRCPRCESILAVTASQPGTSAPFCRDCGVYAVRVSDGTEERAASDPVSPSSAPPPATPKPEEDSWQGTPPVESFGDFSGRARSKASSEREARTANGGREDGSSRTTSTEDREETLLQGRRQVEADIARGYEIYLVAGIPSSGKTQMLEAYERIRGVMAREYELDDEGRAKATTESTIIPRYIHLPPRKVSILDAPGELFYRLLPEEGRISAQALELQQLIGRNLRGVVLAIDLVRLWAPELAVQEGESPQESWSQQLEVAAWNLTVLRWARFGDQLTEQPKDGIFRTADAEIRRQVAAMERRLDVPVLVLLTKADQLRHVQIPGRGRAIAPETEPAIFLVRHALPELDRALRAHAELFRCDFAFSLMTDPVHGAVVRGAPPCGVDLNLRWLLDTAEETRRRDGHHPLPTGRLLRLQERWDRLTLRGRRWDTLT